MNLRTIVTTVGSATIAMLLGLEGPAAAQAPEVAEAASEEGTAAAETPATENTGAMPTINEANTSTTPTASHMMLSREAVDPTAALMQIRFEGGWTQSFHDVDGDAWDLAFRPTLPFKVWGVQNILKLSMPYQLDTPGGGKGLADTEVMDVAMFNQSWGRWVVGAVANIRPSDGADDRVQAGLAGGFTANRGRFSYGAFVKSFFSPDTQGVTIQPLAMFSFNDSFSVSTGDWQIPIDIDAGELSAIPISLEADYILKAGNQPLRLYVNPQYNPLSQTGSFELQVTAGVGMLVPGT
jgi:hypothetical protein